jgi:hypothetical protein
VQDALNRAPGVAQSAGLWHLEARGEVVGTRRHREAASRAYLGQRAGQLARLCALPWVRAVAVSGSLAHLNLVSGKRDLDLFVVMDDGRLWSGLLPTWWLRRRHAPDFCINYMVSRGEPRLPVQGTFDGHQLIHLRPVMGRKVIEELWEANADWVSARFPNWRAPDRGWAEGLYQGERSGRLRTPLGAALEGAVRSSWIRRKGYARNGTQEIYGPHIFKRHDHSHRHGVMDRFRMHMARLGHPVGDDEFVD